MLVECLRSEIPPKEFWGVLLFHTVPLMKLGTHILYIYILFILNVIWTNLESNIWLWLLLLGRRKEVKLFEKIHIDEFEYYCTQVLDKKIEDSWLKLVQRMKRWHYKECGYFNISEDLKPVRNECERYKKFLNKLKNKWFDLKRLYLSSSIWCIISWCILKYLKYLK